MFADYNSLFNDGDNDNKIPDPIIKAMSRDLPEGFKYELADEETLIMVPEREEGFNLSLDIPNIDLDFIDSKKDFWEFLYRSQTKFKVTNEKIRINGEEVEVAKILTTPFEDGKTELFLVPPPFPDPFTLPLTLEDGEEIYLTIKRQPFADLKKSLFKSIGMESLNLSYIIDEEKHSMSMKYKLNLDKAHNIEELIKVLKLAKALLEGRVKIEDIPLKVDENLRNDKEDLEKLLEFWERLNDVSKKLAIEFPPREKVSYSDMQVVNNLYDSLILGNVLKESILEYEWSFEFSEEPNLDLIDKHKGIALRVNAPQILEVLNQKIEVWASILLKNVKVDSIKKVLDKEFTYIVKSLPYGKKEIDQQIKYYRNYEQIPNCEKNILEGMEK